MKAGAIAFVGAATFAAAGSIVSGGGDAEPVFVAGDMECFGGYTGSPVKQTFEGFSNKADVVDGDPYLEIGTTRLSFHTDGGAEGSSNYCRVSYDTSPGEQSGGLEGLSSFDNAAVDPGDHMIMQLWLRPMNGYEWDLPGGANKIMLQGVSADRCDLIIGDEPLHVGGVDQDWYDPLPSPARFTINVRNNNWPQNIAAVPTAEDINDGAWHRITVQVRVRSVGAEDGALWVWVDGTLVLYYDGADAGRPEFGAVDTPQSTADWGGAIHLLGTRNTPTTVGTHTIDFDSVRCWRPQAEV